MVDQHTIRLNNRYTKRRMIEHLGILQLRAQSSHSFAGKITPKTTVCWTAPPKPTLVQLQRKLTLSA